MPLKIDDGVDVALVRNNATGRFDVLLDASGNPVWTDSQEHTVMSLLLEFEGGYIFDQTGKRGSRLRRIVQDKASTAADLRAAILDALDPAIQDGRIRNVVPTVTKLGPGRYKCAVKYQNRSGHMKNFDIPYGY